MRFFRKNKNYILCATLLMIPLILSVILFVQTQATVSAGISGSDVRSLTIIFGSYFAVVLIAGLLILWRLFVSKRKETLQYIRERNLRYILYGHGRIINDDKFLSDAGLPDDPDVSFVVAIFYDPSYNASTSSYISKIVERHMNAAGISGEYFEDLNGPVFIFWSDNKESSLNEDVCAMCKRLNSSLSGWQSQSLQICISDQVSGIGELSNAFYQTADLHDGAGRQNNSKPVLNVRDFSGINSGQSDSFMRAQQNLTGSLLTGKYDQIPAMVDDMQMTFIEPVSDNIEFARLRRRTIANTLSCALLESNLSEDEKEKMITAFRNAKDTASLNEVTEDFFEKTASINTSDSKDAAVYKEADLFIRENLHDHNLSVSMICEAMNISVQRLTRIFHGSNDMAIAEYVNLLRVQEAKELLTKNKDLPVAAVAEEVGYNNAHSLTRNFRKFTGLTPTEYRELEV